MFLVFNATTPPEETHRDPKLAAVSAPHEPSRVALRRAIVRKLHEIFAVQIMKSASVYIAPLSSCGAITELVSWINSSPNNDAVIIEGDFAPEDDQIFANIIEDGEACLHKIAKQKQNEKGKAQLYHTITLLDHFAPLLTEEQRKQFADLAASYSELNALELQK